MSTRKTVTSTTKPRLSRIALPIKRRSKSQGLDFHRSSSCADNSHNFISSGVKRTRSATPSHHQTPNRAIQLNHALIFTSEKAPIDDKKWVHTQIVQITDYVKDIKELGTDFIKRGGLKTMTTKQFVIIVSHLVKFAIGTRLKIGANYTDDLTNILSQINYPYNINKSWLKTPTAPHTLCHVIALLGWLLEFSAKERAVEVIEDINNLIVLEENKNIEFTQFLMKQSKEGYRLWNINQDNELDLKNLLIDQFINTQTEFKNVKDINFKTELLQSELNKLSEKKDCFQKLEKFTELEKSIKECEITEKELIENLEKIKKNVVNKKEPILYRNNQLIELNSEIELLKKNIKNQKMSVTEKEKIIIENNLNNTILNTIINSIQKLSNASFPIEINYSRFIKKKIELISILNNCLFQAKVCGVDIDVDTLKIDLNDKADINPKLDLIIENLNQIKNKILLTDSDYSLNMQDIQKEVAAADYIITILEQKINSANKKCENIPILSKEFQEYFYKEMEKSSKQNLELSEELILKTKDNKNTAILYEEKIERIEYIKNENQKLIKDVQFHINDFIAKEQEDTNQLEIMINQLIAEYNVDK